MTISYFLFEFLSLNTDMPNSTKNETQMLLDSKLPCSAEAPASHIKTINCGVHLQKFIKTNTSYLKLLH